MHTDLELAERLIKENIAKSYKQGNKEEVEVFYEEFGHKSVKFIVRFWTDVRKMKNIRIVRLQDIQIIKNTFDKNGIEIPIPVRTVHSFSHDRTLS